MLVLSRRVGEEIVIAGNIHVTVVAIKGNQVRLSVTAPASVPVARLELLAARSDRVVSRKVGRDESNNRIVGMRK